MTTQKPTPEREGSSKGHQEQTFRDANDKKSKLVSTVEEKTPAIQEPEKEK